MILLLVSSLFVAYWSFKRGRILKRYRRDETVGAKFLGHVFEWSCSLAIVLLFYYALVALLATGWQWISIGSLQRLETWLTSVQQFFDHSFMNWKDWLVIYFIVYCFGRMWIRLISEKATVTALKKGKHVLEIATTAAFLLASFTLLGNEPGKAAVTLEVRINQARTEYGVLRQGVSHALANATAAQAYQNAIKAFPDGEKTSDLAANAISEGSSLKTKYADAQAKYNFHDDTIAGEVQYADQRTASVGAAASATAGDTSSLANDHDAVPETLTYRQISEANSEMESLGGTFRSQLFSFLDQPSGKEILLLLPDGPLDHIAGLLEPFAHAFPVFRPVFDVLRSTLSDSLEVALDHKTEELTASIAAHRENAKDLISATAQEVTDAFAKSPSLAQQQQFRRDFNALQSEVSQLGESAVRLDNSVNAIAEERTLREFNASKQSDATDDLDLGREGRGTDGSLSGNSDDGATAMAEFRQGIAEGWAVTRNSSNDPSKLFVHRIHTATSLSDLQFVIKESADGGSWRVYRPSEGSDGSTAYGDFVGTISTPTDVEVEECTCE